MSSGATNSASFTYCTKCGNPLQSGSRFCSKCGRAVGSVDKPRVDASSASAKDLFTEALVLSLNKDSGIPAIPLLQKALALGLPPDDEVAARLSLGEAYGEIFSNSGLAWQSMIQTNEFRQYLIEIEKAFELDRAGSHGYFSEPLNIGRLGQLDLTYTLVARGKREQEGPDSAIAYLVGKLKAVEYLPRPPLLLSLVELGKLYQQKGAVQNAVECLTKVLDAEPLYPADEERNQQLHVEARHILTEIQGLPPRSSGTPSATRAGSDAAVTSDLSSIERMAQTHPDDESCQKALATTLADHALANCERDPKDGSVLFDSLPQIRHAHDQLTRAMALKFNDAQLRANLEAMLKEVNSMERRKFVGSWFLMIIWGFFYIVPGILFWAAFRRPQYLINRDYLDHLRTGKHIGAGARIGGAMGKVYDFCEKLSPDWGWIFGLIIFVMLSPVFVLLAFKENYLDVKKNEKQITGGLN